jgi:Cu+-exporting ATPase
MTKLAASLPSTPEQPAQRDEVREGAEERSMKAAEAHGAIDRQDLARIGFLTIAAVFLWTANPPAFVGGAATLIGGYPIFKEAIEHLRERRMTMELSMTLALGAALVIGEAFTAVVITTFVLIAEILEGLTVSQGRQAIRRLLDLLPQRVRVRRDGDFTEIAAADLRIGDAIQIRPGERIPVDGTVIHGESRVDQAAITGEPTPVRKGIGARVLAGTVNQAGSLEVRADRIGRDTSFGQIIDAVERADQRRAPIQKTADRLAAYLVYFAASAAVVTFIITRDMRSTISVVIVAGACGVAAGTPLAILGAIGRAARMGAIIKGGIHLETLWAIDAVVLDKTGTVTFGEPRVTAVYPASGIAAHRLIEAAAIAEHASEHPLGRAIVNYAVQRGVRAPEPSHFSYVPGRGVLAMCGAEEILVGNNEFVTGGRLPDLPRETGAASVVFVNRGGEYLGALAIADMPRPEAKRAIAGLHDLGIRTHLLTGDSHAATTSIARELGVDGFEGDLLPDAKLARVETLVRDHTVAMVGDGINDAPALVAANVGVAMGSGTDVARESADVVLIGNDLLRFVDVVKLARRTRNIILANFAGTLAVDAIGMALAALGLLSPLLAAVIHVTSELVFILNSARLVSRSS